MPHPASPSHTERLDQDHDGIQRAARLLSQGGLVAFGTETVYGLGGLATSQKTVERIFSAKGRPAFNPLISHFATAEAAFAELDMTAPLADMARKLAEHFWPGPLTLILPRHSASRICPAVTAGLATLAVRVPKGRAVESMLKQLGAPVAAPSANRSGRVSPSTARHVLDELDGRIDAVLDSGPCPVGLESTVLDLSGDRPILRRPGGVTLEALQAICGPVMLAEDMTSKAAEKNQDSSLGRVLKKLLKRDPNNGSHPSDPLESEPSYPGISHPGTFRPNAPGQLSSHYAPSLPVRLDATSLRPGEAFLGFGDHVTLPEGATPLSLNLSPSGNLEEAARSLFAGLRQLDQAAPRYGLSAIAVAPLPEDGLGRALRDRLQRAAAPRPTDIAPPTS